MLLGPPSSFDLVHTLTRHPAEHACPSDRAAPLRVCAQGFQPLAGRGAGPLPLGARGAVLVADVGGFLLPERSEGHHRRAGATRLPQLLLYRDAGTAAVVVVMAVVAVLSFSSWFYCHVGKLSRLLLTHACIMSAHDCCRWLSLSPRRLLLCCRLLSRRLLLLTGA